MENQGIIKISESEETAIGASAAKVHLRVAGENFVYGNAALEKTVELKNLVQELKQLGVNDEDFAVKSVSVQTESGFFAKTSKGVYQIQAKVQDLSLLSNVLGAIATQKNAALVNLEWIFDEDETRLELARLALLKAKRKAELMAETIGCTITGVRSCSDSSNAPTVETKNFDAGFDFAASPAKSRARQATADIGTEFRGEKTVSVRIYVEFIIVKNAA